MRVLVATTAGAGHFAALVPFAAAIRDAGHAVRVAAAASFGPEVQKAGFDHVPLADPPPEEIGTVFAKLPGLSREEANAAVLRDVYCDIDARVALPAMQAVVDQWRPDVILRETAEFASYLVAERNGTPHVQVAISLESLEDFMQPLVDQPLRQLGSSRGMAGLIDAPRFSLLPASLEDELQRPSRPTYRFRHATVPASEPDLPREWWSEFQAPLVYVTFGSVAAGLGFFPHFYRAVVAALADVPVRVLLTLGEAGDPHELGPLLSNIHVERWWPQEQVVPRCAAMITHGGFGTTLLGLSSGIPMVVVPLFALDQYANAGRIQAVGAGVALEDEQTAPARLTAALQQILNSPDYRIAAGRLADEIAHLPHPAECIGVLESLVKLQVDAAADGDNRAAADT